MLSGCTKNTLNETNEKSANSVEQTQGKTKAQLIEYVQSRIEGFNQFDELFEMLDKDQNNLIDDEEFSRRFDAIEEIMSKDDPDYGDFSV